MSRSDELAAELSETIRRLAAGEITAREANAITRRASVELRTVEGALKAAKMAARTKAIQPRGKLTA